jgi:acetyl esterase/lipase
LALTLVKRHTKGESDWLVYRELSYAPPLPAGSHSLDLFVPTRGQGPWPLIIFIHGGGWAAGDKSAATFFEVSKRHYALASINYRLLWQAPFPAQIEDCKAAVSFLRSRAKQYNLDPDRVGVWGCSSGGHLAMLLETTGNGEVPEWERECHGVSSRVEAVCDWAGPSDLTALIHCSGLDRRMRIYTKNLVGPPAPGRELKWQWASPVRYIKQGDPPVLIMHASGDKLVPISQSEELAKCLKAKGVDCIFKVIDAPQHCFYSFENERIVADFFDRVLKRGSRFPFL